MPMAPGAAPSRKRKRRNLMQGFSSSITPDGRRVVSRQILNAKGIENARNEEHRQMLERVKGARASAGNEKFCAQRALQQ
jgi:hypothetical protein